MQVDSHFYVTYILCRWAGIDHNKSSKIAYASQYVDDNTMSKLIKFSDNTIFKPECTAHSELNAEQLSSYGDAEVLMPFHFFPASDNGKTYFFEKNIDLKSIVFGEKIPNDIDPYIYLGLLLHVVADTYSHQEFYGFRNNDNCIDVKFPKYKHRIEVICKNILSFFSKKIPIGHAAALDLPDVAGYKWSYVRNKKAYLVDNEFIFLQAYKTMYSIICFFIKNIFEEHFNREKDTDYVTIMLSVVLEDFAEECRSEEYRCLRWRMFINTDFNEDFIYNKNEWISDAITINSGTFFDKILFKPVFDYIRCDYKNGRLAFRNSNWYQFQKCAKYFKTLYKIYNPTL